MLPFWALRSNVCDMYHLPLRTGFVSGHSVAFKCHLYWLTVSAVVQRPDYSGGQHEFCVLIALILFYVSTYIEAVCRTFYNINIQGRPRLVLARPLRPPLGAEGGDGGPNP